MTGGLIEAEGELKIPNQFDEQEFGPWTGTEGHLDLYGGEIRAGTFHMGSRNPHVYNGGIGTMDITEGTLVVTGDVTEKIQGYIDDPNGWITAYARFGGGVLELDYDVRNPGMTTLTAVPYALTENFDSLEVGSSMHDVDGWQGWKGDPNAGAQVTDAVAYSGTNSLEIVGNRDDLEALWPAVDTGTFDLTVMQYVPAATGGAVWFWVYGVGTIVVNCGTEKVYVNDLDAATRVEADLIRDQWVEMKFAIDLDLNTCDFYYGDVLLGSRECTESSGVDIWPDGNVDVVYYDDFKVVAAE
jgi:hypothetical protein